MHAGRLTSDNQMTLHAPCIDADSGLATRQQNVITMVHQTWLILSALKG